MSVSRFKELDWISGRVLKQDLRPADAAYNLTAKAEPGGAQSIDLGWEIGMIRIRVQPRATGFASIRHRASAGAGRTAQSPFENCVAMGETA
jgi:hypothetical protein